MTELRILMAVIRKEWLLLFRDRAGLLVLFVMPAVLVTILTLVQDNALTIMGNQDIRLLLIDDDGKDLGRQIVQGLENADGVSVTRRVGGAVPDRQGAMQRVADGEFQVGLIIPFALTDRVRARARQSALAIRSGGLAEPPATPVPKIALFFDPSVMGGFRAAVGNMVALMMYKLEVREKFTALAGQLEGTVGTSMSGAFGQAWAPSHAEPSAHPVLTFPDAPLIEIREGQLKNAGRVLFPTAVQHNVPAWSLFGIFFIVLPMAGAFIQERFNGTYQRLLALPVHYLVLVLGRVVAYMGVCLAQCALIGCIGVWILPLWGVPPLEIAGSLPALGLVGTSAILAAAGYGILLGTVVNSFEQAAMFGPISIVVAAAIGGIMVPVYAMPAFMQKMSVISPLAWGLNGTIEVFVRGGGIFDVLPESGALFAFGVGCIAVSWLWRCRQR